MANPVTIDSARLTWTSLVGAFAEDGTGDWRSLGVGAIAIAHSQEWLCYQLTKNGEVLRSRCSLPGE